MFSQQRTANASQNYTLIGRCLPIVLCIISEKREHKQQQKIRQESIDLNYLLDPLNLPTKENPQFKVNFEPTLTTCVKRQ